MISITTPPCSSSSRASGFHTSLWRCSFAASSDRIGTAIDPGTSRCHSEPLHDTFSGLAGTDRHRELLCRVRDYSLDKKGLTLKSLADLYRDVSQQYGPVGVDVLADWLVKGNQGQMETAAALLEETSTQFVFDQLELVVRALDRAEAFGNECLRKVAGVFYKIAMSGIRSGTPGQPFPQDIALREQCQKLLPQLPADRTCLPPVS